MNNKLKDFKLLLSKTTAKIKCNLIDYFNNYDYSNPNKDVQIIELNSENDLDKLFYDAGFYIILTNFNFNANECEFEYKGLKAIYRGHSYFTKLRLISHLANNKYNFQIQEKKISTHYKNCIKIEDGINGINIDQSPYKDWKWTIIIHKMKGSSKLIREIAEEAFDYSFKKPIKSKDKK